MANSSDLQQFGDEYLDWKEWPEQAFGAFSAGDSQYYAAETAIADGRGLRALELGFGNGSLLAWLKERGVETFGVEASPRLVDEATKLLGPERAFNDLTATALQRLAGTFTHVIAIDVLEHVPQEDLGALLAQLAALLAPGGRIIARFPNGDSPFGRIHQHGDPTHVTTLGRAKIGYFAQRAGLEIVCLRAPKLPAARLGLWRGLRRRLLLAARGVVERIVGLLYFGGQRVPLDPNYVVVLARRGSPTAR
jgi:2-polyprenyl-3-methyl-5-hydroxy-6-metoxy-1,4-benzoquinol methylase